MTLKDIADEAGVSLMTVSNVINGKKGSVSAKTIEKVNTIIEKYNYVPNLTARSLMAKSSKIVAVIVPINEKVGSRNLFDDPYVSTMLGIIEQTLRENGYFAMIRSASTESEISMMIRNWNVDGSLFLLPEFDRIVDNLIGKDNYPMVFFDSCSKNPDILNVTCEDKKGTYLATKYLIDHGHTGIAFVSDYNDNPLLTRRFEGYLKALKENSIAFNPHMVIRQKPDYEGGIEAGKGLSKLSDISAVITTSDTCAVGILEGAKLSGVRVPSELSLIGFDNLSLCNYTTPKITTVSQHIREKAEKGVHLLIEKMTTGSVKNNQIVIDVELIERQSVSSRI